MIILEKERSENARSYAVRVLLYNIIHLELQPGTAVSENELPARCLYQEHLSVKR